MINALRNRTKEAVIKLSNNLNSIDSAHMNGNYVKMDEMINMTIKEFMTIQKDINKYKDGTL